MKKSSQKNRRFRKMIEYQFKDENWIIEALNTAHFQMKTENIIWPIMNG